MAEMIMILLPAILIMVVFILFLKVFWRNYKESKAGFTLKDERTMKIEGMAGRVTVMVMMYFLLGLLYYSFVSENLDVGLPEFDPGVYLIIALLFNISLYAGLRWYFGRNVELV
ncbi:hypothetical protein ACT9XH_02100 [Methanococcoides methylutens]|uniref:hypothetical protein n=1 Tax=Methanococcoides methylutens TaxID=2226 RepID=UPI004044324D